MKYLLAAILLLGATGCGGSSTTSPSDTSVTGSWIGAINNTSLGRADVTATLTQSGSTISGSWLTAYETTPAVNYSGQLSGTKTGAGVSVTLTPAALYAGLACSYTYNSTLSTATLMTGTFASFGCPNGIVDSGTLTLTKQ
jgi:hypothetical protein